MVYTNLSKQSHQNKIKEVNPKGHPTQKMKTYKIELEKDLNNQKDIAPKLQLIKVIRDKNIQAKTIGTSKIKTKKAKL